MAKLATKVILGKKLKELGYENGLAPEKEGIFVKVPVFSFSKLTKVDITLGPEMKSTGEVMGKDSTLEKALYKGLIAAGRKVPLNGTILFTIDDKHKPQAKNIAKRFLETGFKILATQGTAIAFEKAGIKSEIVYKIADGDSNNTILEKIQRGEVHYVVNTLSSGKKPEKDGFRIRRSSVENGVPCFTSLDTVEAVLKVIESMTFKMEAM
jgi:carbamoyl-phosphate synthase large subunit